MYTEGSTPNHSFEKSSTHDDEQMPDVAKSMKLQGSGILDRVGMSGIEVPILLDCNSRGLITSHGKASAYVNLKKPEAKGIHMSRLYLSLSKHLEDESIKLVTLSKILADFISGHKDLSDSAYVDISYTHSIKRPSLKSSNQGWRQYPVTLKGKRQGSTEILEISFDITYSSTCPCSAALSRQIIQQKFASDFKHNSSVSKTKVLAWLEQNGTIATPHSQRSIASISVTPKDPKDVSIEDMILNIEETLETPVQGAVKREDEKEFARRNGKNLMFAEDAARRIQKKLMQNSNLKGFKVHVSHLESLHPHDAVAVVTH